MDILILLCVIALNHPEYGEQCQIVEAVAGTDVAEFCSLVPAHDKEITSDARLVTCREYNHEKDHERLTHQMPTEFTVMYCVINPSSPTFGRKCELVNIPATTGNPIAEYCKILKRGAGQHQLKLIVCRAYNPDTDRGRL